MAVAYDPSARLEITTWDVEYRRNPIRNLLARIYQPQGNGPFPVLLDVHGGAWNGQDGTSASESAGSRRTLPSGAATPRPWRFWAAPAAGTSPS